MLNGHYVLVEGEERGQQGKMKSTQTPMTIDQTWVAGPREGISTKGIFKVEGDLFTACFGGRDGDRPTKFTTADGLARALSVWKRLD